MTVSGEKLDECLTAFSFSSFEQLRSFELPKAIYLESKPFTMEASLLTPTFKNKRPELKSHYKDKIAELYEVPI